MSNEESWNGHKFKEVVRGVWKCECGTILYKDIKSIARHAVKVIGCALRGHGGIGSDSRCKRCHGFVNCNPFKEPSC